jgi:hypothetical protein
MSKFLRRSVADKSPIYKAITAEALALLNTSSHFRKDTVITTLGLQAFADAVRWDYVRLMLQDQLGGVELVPVAEAYFQARIEADGKMTKNTEELRKRLPERFVAAGHGKKTAGYVTVVPENEHLVIVVARRKDAQAKGTDRVANKFVRDALGRGCKVPLLSEDANKLIA